MSLDSSTTRKKRQRFLDDDLKRLEESYRKKSCPTSLEKEQLAEELRIPKRRIQVWFQNRNAKAKRQKLASAPASAPGTATTPVVSRSNNLHTESPDRDTIINNPVLDESNALSMTELTPSAAHAISPRSEMAPVFLCQPAHTIDTVRTDFGRHHSRYYGHPIYFTHPGQRSTEQIQHQHIIQALPTFASMQHHPSSFRPSSRPMIPFYLHDGPSGFDNIHNYPTNYVSVPPNLTGLYLLSHENQQSQHLLYYHHRHRQPPASITSPNRND